MDRKVYEITHTEMIPISNLKAYDYEADEYEKNYKALFKSYSMEKNKFYFSYDYDLTKSV